MTSPLNLLFGISTRFSSTVVTSEWNYRQTSRQKLEVVVAVLLEEEVERVEREGVGRG